MLLSPLIQVIICSTIDMIAAAATAVQYLLCMFSIHVFCSAIMNSFFLLSSIAGSSSIAYPSLVEIHEYFSVLQKLPKNCIAETKYIRLIDGDDSLQDNPLISVTRTNSQIIDTWGP